MNVVSRNYLKNAVIRDAEGKFFFFDETGVYCYYEKEGLTEQQIDSLKNLSRRNNGEVYWDGFDLEKIGYHNKVVLKMAARRLKVGDDFDRFDYLIDVSETFYYKGKKFPEYFILEIKEPVFYKGFDPQTGKMERFVYIDFRVKEESIIPNREMIIERRVEEFSSKAKNEIKKHYWFRKYRTLIKELELYHVTLFKHKNIVQFVFIIK